MYVLILIALFRDVQITTHSFGSEAACIAAGQAVVQVAKHQNVTFVCAKQDLLR